MSSMRNRILMDNTSSDVHELSPTQEENLNVGSTNPSYGDPRNGSQSDERTQISEATMTRRRKGNTGGEKRKRGKAKGIDTGKNIEVDICDGRIITPKAVSEIGVLFNEQIKGSWITFTDYPKSELETLYKRYKRVGFIHNYPEEEVKKAFEKTVKLRYANWMFRLRDPIFKKYKTLQEIYKHPPSSVVSFTVWKGMVDTWWKEKWKGKSTQNKLNRSQSQIIPTTGRVCISQRKKDWALENDGKELGPFQSFKMFHTKQDNETWTTTRARELHEEMESRKLDATSDGSPVNEWQIYKEVVGESKHGHVLGFGSGITAKDVYGSSSYNNGCSKRCMADRTKGIEEHAKEKEVLTTHIHDLQKNMKEMRDGLPQMIQSIIQSFGKSPSSTLENGPPSTVVQNNNYHELGENRTQHAGYTDLENNDEIAEE